MRINNKQIYFILACICFLTYANSLNNQFVSDDIDNIVNNKLITSPLNYWLFPSTVLNCIDYLIGKLNPFLFHLTNILLHSVATILVFFFLRLFFKTEASLLSSALFAAHPIHAEAVTWISGRPYIMTTIFVLICYFLYYNATDSINPFNPEAQDEKSPPAMYSLKAQRQIRFIPYLSCLLIFLYYLWNNFSFFFIFPFFIVLSDVTFRSSRKFWNWRIPLRWLPFFAIVALRLLLAKGIIFARISSVAKDAGIMGSSWMNPLFNLIYSLSRHLGLFVWPANLTLYHEPPVIELLELRLGIIILFIFLFFLPLIFKKTKELFFAIFLFFIFLGPTYSPVMVSWLLAERYVYFPSVALCIFTSFFYEKYAIKTKKIKRETAFALFLIIVACYAVRTVARNEDWKTPEKLWRQTIIASPDSPRAHNNMGDSYGKDENFLGAIREFKKAIELRPDYADAYHNLANTYQMMGNLTEAAKYYKLAVTFNPELYVSYFNLGVIYLNTNQIDLAIETFTKAAELNPGDPDVHSALRIAVKKKEAKQ